ncbi:JMJD7-like protein [Mya arenaria]|uniref:JMJD7-like protein n=1 Tax=Mya arenaria TaxID=6604 RepID=A0ABY7FGB7_MYAAR|nr:JMJD7-like protein [Mya arenaria]
MESKIKNDINDCLNNLSNEARELYLDRQIPVLANPPSPLEFYRDYVSANKPVLINNAINHWPALTKWNNDYLRKNIGDREVTVAVTPNGYADAITDQKFVLPEQRQLKFSHFLDIIEKPKAENGVLYVQKQNSNLTDEFVSIIGDVDTQISWGSEAFNKRPDAVNFWMGDERAITSMHRDHYENLYCVVRGKLFDVGTFKEVDGRFIIEPNEDMDKVPWIAIDPLSPDYARYPKYRRAEPIEVTVKAGQLLYLPSLWFHHVRQSHACIAVNYWYDMEFDIKYNYYKCVEALVDIVK